MQLRVRAALEPGHPRALEIETPVSTAPPASTASRRARSRPMRQRLGMGSARRPVSVRCAVWPETAPSRASSACSTAATAAGRDFGVSAIEVFAMPPIRRGSAGLLCKFRMRVCWNWLALCGTQHVAALCRLGADGGRRNSFASHADSRSAPIESARSLSWRGGTA